MNSAKMIKTLYLLSALVCCTIPGLCQKYAIFDIPEAIINENANVIIRYDSAAFEIHDESAATIYKKYAVTILNKKGEDYADHFVFYDEAEKVKSFDGRLYNSAGEEVKKLKNRDIKDYAAVSSISIYEDNRVQYAKMVYPDYPYTVEYEYEKQVKDLLFYPMWHPVSDENVSVEYSVQSIICPKTIDFRHKGANLTEDIEIRNSDDNKIYSWRLRNFEAIDREPYSPALYNYTPVVYTAPNQFVMDDYSGNAKTWQDIGRWVLKLNDGRDEIPDELNREIQSITASLPDQRSKIKALYKYLQNNTRYVSIQLGIGGWQPFTASYVYENGYGDCKALSNYMYAMLKAAGIKSNYTLVRAGDHASPVDSAFPMRRFNHAFLCVPNDGDTIWLECTNQDIPFGYLGRFTNDRNVLVVNENGGHLVRTPANKKEDNLQLRNATVTLETDGSAKASVATVYKGLQFENVRYALHLNEEEQKKQLYKRIDIPSFDILDFSYDHTYEQHPKFDEALSLFMRRYATVSGKRIFFKPNLMNKQAKLDKPMKPRKYDLEIRTASIDVDSVIFRLPAEYHPEYMPEDIEINSHFGRYTARFDMDQGRLLYIRRVEYNKGLFAPEQYEDFVEFKNNISESDNIKIVLVKST